MCANYEPIARSRALLLNLFEPTFDYKTDIFPSYSGPILIGHDDQIEWRLARFGLVPNWANEIPKAKTYNARTETISTKRSFQHAWKNNQFCLIPVETIFEPKYIHGKAHWYGIYRQDDMPFTVAGIYEYATLNNKTIISMSMLTINADMHPFMNEFHAPEDEKRSIIVIPPSLRNGWLSCTHEDASDYFVEMPVDEFTAAPKSEMSKFRPTKQ
ncbi:SOS response-associated peptidase family protein [Acinetobacter sp. VNK23]|uniref:SOS response-associated peptidase n=1 Tax=Acinetobacter thutiue TaxID=2998078 RepID=UPI0025759751|nr:SOS response-associated peptidase family protein [Acinetobacter thutiue]MDM1021566.1 SOS response-associated peptidase family protein [Acinetobacter thutiue]